VNVEVDDVGEYVIPAENFRLLACPLLIVNVELLLWLIVPVNGEPLAPVAVPLASNAPTVKLALILKKVEFESSTTTSVVPGVQTHDAPPVVNEYAAVELTLPLRT
jgi:hypothetical protein